MSIELNKIYNVDCLEGMKEIPDKMVDLVVVDPPFGLMNVKRPSDAWKNRQQMPWDNIIDSQKMFSEYERIVRPGGYIIIFSLEPYTSHLRTQHFKNITFCYPCVYVKNRPGSRLVAKNAPVGYFEDINVFIRNNPRHDFNGLHPLRTYAQQCLDYLGITGNEICKRLGDRKAEHFFYRHNSSQFKLCTRETYQRIIDIFHIEKMDGFLSYDELKKIDGETVIAKKYPRIFNRPNGVISNVFSFPKDKGGFHPTQKPVALIEQLIEIYSNPGDIVLDNCIGSGTTAIAAIRSKRKFIGFETDEKYFKYATRRIEEEQQKLF